MRRIEACSEKVMAGKAETMSAEVPPKRKQRFPLPDKFPCGCDATARFTMGRGKMIVLADKSRLCPCGKAWRGVWEMSGELIRKVGE